MAIDNHQLIGMQRAEFAKAAHLQLWVARIQMAIAAVAGASVFITDTIGTYAAAIAAAVLALIWAWFGWEYRASRSQAERARRATLLMEGLGERISKHEVCELMARFTVSTEAGRRNEDPNYYAARAEPGDKRLAEMLEESAFWSADLMRHSAQRTWMKFIAYLVLGLLLLFASFPFVSTQDIQGGVRVFCALLTLLVSTEVIGAAFAYSSSSSELSAILPRLEAARGSGFPRADLLYLLSDYNAAVEGAPMYPPGVYESRKDRLNELWNQRRS